MSSGFRSFFCHNRTNNTTCYTFSCTKYRFRRKRKISSEFSNRHQTIAIVLSDFSKTQRYNLKTFQIAIHFHPCHPQLKILTDSLDIPI